jgi:hypothetical protein
VAAAAELGHEPRDVEDAGQDSTRPVRRRRGSEWHVGEGSGAGLHSGGLCSSDGEVRCTGGRKFSGGSGWRGKVWRAGARAGSGGARTEATRAQAQRGAGAAGAAHLAGQWRRRAAEEKQRGGRER